MLLWWWWSFFFFEKQVLRHNPTYMIICVCNCCVRDGVLAKRCVWKRTQAPWLHLKWLRVKRERESQVSPPVMQTVWCPLQCGVQSSYIETVGWQFLNTTLQRGKVLHSRVWYCVSVMQRSWVKAWGRGVSRMTPRHTGLPCRDYFAPAQSGDGQQESGWLGGAANVKTHPARACHAMFEPGMPRNAPCPPQLYMPPT